MKKRSVPAIALKASNEEGGYFCMSLYSGKRINRYIWEELPIDQDTIYRVEQLAREGKQPVLDNNQPLFEWLPGKEIEDYQHDPIIQEEEEPQKNEIEQQQNEIEQQLEIEEENYIAYQETIGDEEEEQDISETNDSVEDIINDFGEIDNQMSGIIDDLNDSRYDNAHINDSETEVSKINHTYMDEDTSHFEDALQPQKRLNIDNSGQGIARLEPTFTGKKYDDVKNKVQFLMDEKKHETKKKNRFDVETSIKAAVNIMFTQMQATQGYK